jgi:predicted ATPase
MMGVELPQNADTLHMIGEVCRRLDGTPLAIELVAVRIATLGLREVIARLNERLDWLNRGFRGAPRRQQTLRATFEWSYSRLDGAASRLFRRLSFFESTFTAAEAHEVAGDSKIS